jgi:hypothetical protein
VLADRGVVVDAQYVIALRPELVVVGGQPHLLPVRLETSATQDSPYARLTHLPTHAAEIVSQKMRRPLRDRYAYVARRTTGFGDNLRAVRVGEREGGRPERGASASLSLGATHAKRVRQRKTVRSWMPSTTATSAAATPSAIMSSACARFAIRCAVVPTRSTASARSRSSRASASGTVGRPQ